MWQKCKKWYIHVEVVVCRWVSYWPYFLTTNCPEIIYITHFWTRDLNLTVNCNIGWLQILILLRAIKLKQLDLEEKLTEKVNDKLTSKLDYKLTEKLTGKH